MASIAFSRPETEPVPPEAPASGTRRSFWLAWLMAGIAVVYCLSATWGGYYAVDPFTNAIQAHAWAADGGPIVEGADDLTRDPSMQYLAWMVDSPRGTTTQYPPGVGLWGGLFYLPASGAEIADVEYLTADGSPAYETMRMPSLAPATAAAVSSVVLAMLFLALTLRQVVSDRATQVAVALAALGTGAWSVAADRLWQHGPGMMCISLGTYLASRNRFFAAGLAFGGGVLVRPHIAVIAAAFGIAITVNRRTVRPMLAVGAGATIGLVLLLGYNYWLWDSINISGGYGTTFTTRAVNNSAGSLLTKIGQFFVHGRVGILWTSPFLAIGLVGLARGRRIKAPDWAVGAAIGGLLYTVVQLQANRVTGGAKFFAYRYPLEPLMAAAPLLTMATVLWLQSGSKEIRPIKIGILGVLGGLSMVAHGWGAIFVW